MNNKQIKTIALDLATMVHNSLAWEEALNGDIIELLTKEFTNNLKALNSDD